MLAKSFPLLSRDEEGVGFVYPAASHAWAVSRYDFELSFRTARDLALLLHARRKRRDEYTTVHDVAAFVTARWHDLAGVHEEIQNILYAVELRELLGAPHREVVDTPHSRERLGDDLLNVIASAESIIEAIDLSALTPNSVVNLGNSTLNSRVLKLSEEVISIVRDGFSWITSESLSSEGQNLEASPGALTNEQISEFVQLRLELLLSSLATRSLYGAAQGMTVLASQGRFTDTFEYWLRERLPARPRMFTQLSEALYRDVISYIRAGGVLGGAWGDLEEANGSLRMTLTGERKGLAPPRKRLKVEYG